MTTKQLIKTGRCAALISFLAGTLIAGLYFRTSSSDLLFAGYSFVVLAGIINAGILTAILLRAGKDNQNRKRLLTTSGFMLANIPVMLMYGRIIMLLLGTMRITFINGTGVELSDIKIIGCGGRHIGKLNNGECTTVCVKITGDCSISLKYRLNGKETEAVVAGYVTDGMGQKVTHTIDGKDKDID